MRELTFAKQLCKYFLWDERMLTARWTTTLTSKVRLHHAINFSAFFMQIRTYLADFRGGRNPRSPPCECVRCWANLENSCQSRRGSPWISEDDRTCSYYATWSFSLCLKLHFRPYLELCPPKTAGKVLCCSEIEFNRVGAQEYLSDAAWNYSLGR